MQRRSMWLALLSFVLVGLAACVRAPATAEPTTEVVTAGVTETAASPTPAPSPTATPTPTPIPYQPTHYRLPFDPADLDALAYRARLRVTFAPADRDPGQALPVHEATYTALNTPAMVDAAVFWLPPEARSEDFLWLFGQQAVLTRRWMWQFAFNGEHGMWTDGHLDVAWNALDREGARQVLVQDVLAEVGRLDPAWFLWFPAGEETVAGLPARRFNLAVADAEAVAQTLTPTWLYDPTEQAVLYGQTQWETTDDAVAWLAEDDTLLGLRLHWQGTFTANDGRTWPVVLHMVYEIEDRRTADQPGEPLQPDRYQATGDVFLPSLKRPTFVLERYADQTSFAGTPHTGLVWVLRLPGLTAADAAELADLYREVALEIGWQPDEVDTAPADDALARLRVTDPDGNAWYISLFAQALQVYQPPFAGAIHGQDRNFFGGYTLSDALCGALGGQARLDHQCVLPDQTECTPDQVVHGACPAASTLPVLLPPGARTCMTQGGAPERADDGAWVCRFGAAEAACELWAYAQATCPRGGPALQAVDIAEEQYTVVLEGHLEPNQVVFYRLPAQGDLTPLAQTYVGDTEEIPLEVLYMGVQMTDAPADVTLSLFRAQGNDRQLRVPATAPMQWLTVTDEPVLLEIRGGAQATDYTLTIAYAPWLIQSNLGQELRGTFDESGVRYFIQPKPLATWELRISGPGVTFDIYEMPEEGSLEPPRLLLRRGTSTVLDYAPDEVLIVAHGVPNTDFVLYARLLQFSPYGP